MTITFAARHCAALAPALVLLMLPATAHAYLDPGTGSMILSAIIGLFATVALAVKTWWYRIKALFRRQGPVAQPASAETTRPANGREPDDDR